MRDDLAARLRSIADLAPGDHLCCLYRSDEEYRAFTVAFLRDGLQRGEKILCLAYAGAADAVLAGLRDAGGDVARSVARGQLVTRILDEAALREAPFEPAAGIAWLRSEAQRAVAEGYPALRVASDMTWACQERPMPDTVVEYEARLNDFFPVSKCLAICQYDLRRSAPEKLLSILYAHPLVVIGAKIYENFYHIPVDELLGNRPAAAALTKVLENLVDHNEAARALRDRQERLEVLVGKRTLELSEANARLRREIEDRTRAGQALEESRHFIERVLEATPGLLYIYDPLEHRTLYANRAAETFFGRTIEEFQRRGPVLVEDFVHPDDVPLVVEHHRRMLGAADGQVGEVEFRVRHADGQWRWLRCRDVPFSRTPDGRTHQILGVAEDVTGHKGVLDALNAERDFIAAVLNTAGALVVVMDREGRIIRFNHTCELVTGYAADEAIGRCLWDLLIVPEEKEPVKAVFGKLVSGDFPNTHENHWISKTGERRLIAWSNTAIVGGRGEVVYVIGTGLDVTEQRRAEEALRQSEERLRQAQKMEAIGRLAGGIAHDFNNQLTVVLGYCDMLLGEMRPDDPLRPWVEEILKASQRSETLTSRLLTFSRKQIMHPEILNLRQVIGDLRALLGRVIGEDIDLRMSFPDDLGRVKADRSLFEQALMNLVVNARDAMPRGGCLAIETANAWLDEAYAAAHPEVVPGAYVAVTVTDTGIGMDRETLQRIFDPFFTTKPVGQGTGLGLPMAYGFVKQSSGHIGVDSTPGKGTAFRLYLPRVEGPAAAPKPAAQAAPKARGAGAILLVEDEDSVRALVARLLRAAGYTVVAAASPGEALAMSEQHGGKFDLLLTDIVMPEMSGCELARRLRAVRADLKVLLVTGYTEEYVIRHGMIDEGMDLLTKPFTPETLAEAVQRALGSPPPA